MTIADEDLQDFQRFGKAKLASGGTVSFDELVEQWKARRQYDRSVAGIREGIAEYEDGKAISVDQAFADARKKILAEQC